MPTRPKPQQRLVREGVLWVYFAGDTSFALDDPNVYVEENDFDVLLKSLSGHRVRVVIEDFGAVSVARP